MLRTSLITGLPYEDEAAFEELCEFLQEVRIERAGVFPYSPEEGTPAAKMLNRVDTDEAERRADLVVDVQSRIMDDFNDSRMGGVTEVLCDGFDSQAMMFVGRSYAESPDIDGASTSPPTTRWRLASSCRCASPAPWTASSPARRRSKKSFSFAAARATIPSASGGETSGGAERPKRKADTYMTTANKLTILRVLMIPVFLVVLYWGFPGCRYVALGIYIVACLTDLLDGYIARPL